MNQKQEKIYDTEEIYRLAFIHTDELIAIVNPNDDLKIKFINESGFKTYLGYSLEDLKDNSFLNIIHPDYHKSIVKIFRRENFFLSERKEIKLIDKNKKDKWFEIKFKRYKDKFENKNIFVKLKPISEKKFLEFKLEERKNSLKKITEKIPEIRFWKLFSPEKFEDALKSSYELLEMVIENIPQYIFWKDNNLNYLGCNKNYAEFLGIDFAENIIGKSDKNLIKNSKKLKTIRQKENQVIDTGKAQINQTESWRTDKSNLLFNVNRIPLIDDESGKSIGILVSYDDITDLKTKEIQLRRERDLLEKIMDTSPVGILLVNKEGEVIFSNAQVEQKLNMKGSEIKRKFNLQKWRVKNLNGDFIPYEDMPFDIIKKTKKPVFDFRFSIELPNQDDVFLSLNAGPLYDIDGNFDGIVVILDDITRELKTKRKIRESEKKFRYLFEKSPYAITLFSLNGTLIDCNKTLKDFISVYDKSELIGKNYKDLILVNQKNKKLIPLIENFAQKVIKHKSQKNLELKLFSNDNEVIWLNFYSSLIEIENKILFQTIIQDITVRKRSEQELKESEQKFRNITEKSLMAIIIMQDFEIKYTNGRFLDTIGYSSEEVLNWKPREFFKIIHPDDRNRVAKVIHKKFKGKIQLVENLQFRLISKTGEIYWVEALSNTINYRGRDADLTSLIDITDRKEAEEKLKQSEKKYRSLLKTSTVGILEIDVNNKNISYVNPRLLNILGYSKKEFDMELIKNIIHPDDYSKIYGDLEEKELEFRIFNKRDEIRWLAGKRIRQYDEKGNLSSVRLWLDDITERKMYEKLITELNIDFLNFTVDIQKNIQMLLKTAINLLEGSVAIYIQKQEADEQYRIITSDNETYTYYDIEEFRENIFVAELFKESHDFPQKIFHIEKTKYTNTDPLIEKYNIRSAYGKLIKSEESFNEAICVLFSDKPTISHEHQLILFLIADAVEIENRRWEVKQYLEDQNRMLNEMNKLKSDLLTRTSHELKTPLISIKGFTELLLKLHTKKMDSDMVSIVEEIMDGAKRMEKIINTLIKSSKLDRDLLDLNKTEEDLGFLIKFCIDEIKGLINLRKHDIKVDLEENLITKFDKERIYEVISNLLVNSVKFTPPGGEIKITSKVQNDAIITSVQDNGVGLTKEEKAQLFKQFGKIERYGKGWDLGIEGSGLGLYICKKIIGLHGGKIWAESEGRNKGSTFYFTLPIVK